MKHLTRYVLVLVLWAATFASACAGIAEHVIRRDISGIDVIVYPMKTKDVVTVLGTFPAGDAFAKEGNPAVATLTGMLLDKGTAQHDKFTIAKELDDVGARLGFSVGEEMVSVSGKSLTRDLPLMVGLLAEQLRTPAFSPAEFTKAQTQLAGSLQPFIDDTGYRARDLFARTLYPKSHPNHMIPISEWIEATRRCTVDDVKRFHESHYGPRGMTLVFVGDVSIEAVQSAVEKAFSGWQGGGAPIRDVAHESLQRAGGEQTVPIPDRTSVSVILGQRTGLRYVDPGNLALRVGTAILGGGFTGRLMKTVRDQQGLTYGIGANIRNDTFVDGEFAITATFAPERLQRGVDSTRQVLEKWWEQGVTEQELADRKRELIGAFEVGLASTDGMAATLLQTVNRGEPLEWMDTLPRRIDALTVEQVNAAIRKYLDPQKMTLIEAGTTS